VADRVADRLLDDPQHHRRQIGTGRVEGAGIVVRTRAGHADRLGHRGGQIVSQA
jgi:hypothetical protein